MANKVSIYCGKKLFSKYLACKSWPSSVLVELVYLFSLSPTLRANHATNKQAQQIQFNGTNPHSAT